jgi:hypothetical protein
LPASIASLLDADPAAAAAAAAAAGEDCVDLTDMWTKIDRKRPEVDHSSEKIGGLSGPDFRDTNDHSKLSY